MIFPCICKEWRLQSEHQMVVLSYLLGPFNLFRLASSKMQIAACRLENLCNPRSLAASGHRCLSDSGFHSLRHSQPEPSAGDISHTRWKGSEVGLPTARHRIRNMPVLKVGCLAPWSGLCFTSARRCSTQRAHPQFKSNSTRKSTLRRWQSLTDLNHWLPRTFQAPEA